MLTQERLMEALNYSPDTGEFFWAAKTCKKVVVGKAAGSRRRDGYVLIRLDRTRYLAHRLAFLYMTGDWPPDDVDHINGDPSDNRWANLRAATRSQNLANKRTHKSNTSGFKGVSCTQDGRWVAQIGFGGAPRYIGSFGTPEEAHEAYKARALSLYGEYARFE